MNEIKVTGRILPISEATMKRNPDLYPMKTAAQHNAEVCGDAYVKPAPQPTGDWPIKPTKPPKRIRQSSKPLLNGLETEYFEKLKEFFPSCKIYPQAIRFKLGNGIAYKPDLVCFDWDCGDKARVKCWEVKGPHAFRGGFENLKVAAGLYSEINWVLVWKDEKGRWCEQAILP